jgi:hypothetical protein
VICFSAVNQYDVSNIQEATNINFVSSIRKNKTVLTSDFRLGIYQRRVKYYSRLPDLLYILVIVFPFGSVIFTAARANTYNAILHTYVIPQIQKWHCCPYARRFNFFYYYLYWRIPD